MEGTLQPSPLPWGPGDDQLNLFKEVYSLIIFCWYTGIFLMDVNSQQHKGGVYALCCCSIFISKSVFYKLSSGTLLESYEEWPRVVDPALGKATGNRTVLGTPLSPPNTLPNEWSSVLTSFCSIYSLAPQCYQKCQYDYDCLKLNLFSYSLFSQKKMSCLVWCTRPFLP